MPALRSVCGPYCSVLNNVKACQGLNLQFVRYKKPRFVPKAPSKLYRVKEPTKVDPVEIEKITKWKNSYNTEMKSLRCVCISVPGDCSHPFYKDM